MTGTSVPKYHSQPTASQGCDFIRQPTSPEMATSTIAARTTLAQPGWISGIKHRQVTWPEGFIQIAGIGG